MSQGPAPLIAHVVAHFGTGGLENGMVMLLNNLPPRAFRHTVICLDGYTEFRRRIRRPDISFHALDKLPGKDFALYGRLYRLLRALRPEIVHTRNLSALEAQFVAAAAGVKGRIHGEHGRDVFDLRGTNLKYNLLRRAARPLVGRYIAVSRDLESWLTGTVGVPPERVTQIYNGVDVQRFHPRDPGVRRIGPAGFADEHSIVIGSVGRMAEVKDYPTLVWAFIAAVRANPEVGARMRLVMVGDGPTRNHCEAILAEAGLGAQAWFAGERNNVPELLRAFDLFVLPSLGEGISNTVLEAMASGLPVIATDVGGNPELVDTGVTGELIPVGDQAALTRALLGYAADAQRRTAHGAAGRAKVEARHSIESMIAGYLRVYSDVARQFCGSAPAAARDPDSAAATGLPLSPRE